MDIYQTAAKLSKKLQVGDRKKIARMTKISIATVYACIEGRKVRPVSKDKVALIIEAAIKILKDRDMREMELNSQIERL